MTSKVRGLLCGLVVATALAASSRPVRAQSDDELKAARELFAEAYKDEQEKRFDLALDKFTRVAKVKESPSVRYRIASVLESLGRLRESRDMFRALAGQKSTMTPKDQPIADSAAERVAALDKRMPRLVLKLPDGAPADARVSIDGNPAPASTTPRAIDLDPGEHVVQATSANAKPYEAKVTLADGNEVPLEVRFEPRVVEPPPPPPPPPPAEPPNHTLAFVALGAGGVFLVTGVALLLVRESDISDINHKCPTGSCPLSDQTAIQHAHDQAALFGPLGIGATALGVVAGGAGVYLLLKRQAPTPGSASPTSPASSGLRVGPQPTRDGVILRMGTTF